MYSPIFLALANVLMNLCWKNHLTPPPGRHLGVGELCKQEMSPPPLACQMSGRPATPDSYQRGGQISRSLYPAAIVSSHLPTNPRPPPSTRPATSTMNPSGLHHLQVSLCPSKRYTRYPESQITLTVAVSPSPLGIRRIRLPRLNLAHCGRQSTGVKHAARADDRDV